MLINLRYPLRKYFTISLLLFLPFISVVAENNNSRNSRSKTGGVDICDTAKAIIADSLKYHPSTDHLFTDIEVDYANPLLLPAIFYGKIDPYSFNIDINRHKGLPPKYRGLISCIYEKELEIDSPRERSMARAMARHPRKISYYWNALPVPPKEQVLNYEINRNAIKIIGTKIEAGTIGMGLPKADRWKISFNSSVQFTQNYISENWYQGGESNINILGLQKMTIKHYDPKGKIEFESVFDVRTGFYTTESDTMRMFRVNDNLLQINTKLGLKAIKNWYYASSLLFKTQIFNNYIANTDQLKSQFLSPAEVNLSVGMDYKRKNKKGNLEYSLLFAPVAYNLKYVANIKEINEQDFGIDEGKHTNSQIGSSFTGNLNWKISNNVNWNARLFYFTNYEQSQADFENVFNFSINKFFSTRLAIHLRYDDGRGQDIRNIQYKELLSFGFNYAW